MERKKYHIDEIALHFNERNQVPCFINQEWYHPKVENLFAFNNEKSGQVCKRYKTEKQARRRNPDKEILIFPVGSFVDWNKWVHGESYLVFSSAYEMFAWNERAKQHLCPWPTEILYNREEYDIPENNIDTMISVANGLCLIHKAILFPNVRNFLIFDVSSRQIEFTEWLIKNWDGKNFAEFQERFSNDPIGENKKWLYEHFRWDMSETKDALERLKDAMYLQRDIIQYKHSSEAVYVPSNSIVYWFRCLDVNVQTMKWEEEEYAKDKELVIFSSRRIKGYLQNSS